MRCLLCHKEIGSDSLYDLLYSNDILCKTCRDTWVRVNCKYMLNGVRGYSPWLYEENFAQSLIQMKEVGDEAIQDIFLHQDRHYLHHRYRKYTLCCMPSSYAKEVQRGFHHLPEIFSCLKLPMIEPFRLIKDTDQKNKSYTERQYMKQNVVLKQDIRLPKNLLLVDDTITTGSTLRGALSCIPNGHKVEILTVSVNKKYVKPR